MNSHNKITLNHPEYLISITLMNVKITNMNECVNLKNIYSLENIYTKEDIAKLRNLKRIYTWNNKYEE
mgnify:CR=1 FL=1